MGLLVLSTKASAQDQDWAARHRAEDQQWAKKTGLTPDAVRQLRLMAEIGDGDNPYVDKLDIEGLSARNHIFLVTAAGNGHCLGLYVFAKRGVSS